MKTLTLKYDSNYVGLPDLGIIEDSPKSDILEELVAQAANSAINENLALGLSTTYVKNRQVITESADGKITVISEIKSINRKYPIKKGTVFHVKSF